MNFGKFRKLIAAVLTVTLLTLSFSGCSKSDFIDFDTIYSELTKEITGFSDSNMQKMGQNALDNFYYIDINDLDEGKYLIYMSDPATGNADEIAMFKVKDADKVVTIKAVVQDRLNDLAVRYESYKPEEMKKIKDAVLETKGNYIFMVVSSDNAKAKDIIKKA